MVRILEMGGLVRLIRGFKDREVLWEIYKSRRMEKVEGQKEQTRQKEHVRLEFESNSRNEEFARVVAAVFMSRLDPTLEETQDVKTAVSEAVTNAIIHGYGKKVERYFRYDG